MALRARHAFSVFDLDAGEVETEAAFARPRGHFKSTLALLQLYS